MRSPSAMMAELSLIRIMLRTLVPMPSTSSLMALAATMRGMRVPATSPSSPVMADSCSHTAATMASTISPSRAKPSTRREEIRRSSIRMACRPPAPCTGPGGKGVAGG